MRSLRVRYATFKDDIMAKDDIFKDRSLDVARDDNMDEILTTSLRFAQDDILLAR